MLAFCLFVFTATSAAEIFTLSLHDALPISPYMFFCSPIRLIREIHGKKLRRPSFPLAFDDREMVPHHAFRIEEGHIDRKSTRLNSSHPSISYAVFCLKKKKPHSPTPRPADH